MALKKAVDAGDHELVQRSLQLRPVRGEMLVHLFMQNVLFCFNLSFREVIVVLILIRTILSGL